MFTKNVKKKKIYKRKDKIGRIDSIKKIKLFQKNFKKKEEKAS